MSKRRNHDSAFKARVALEAVKGALDREVRRGMIERAHPKLSVGAQCQLLSISRSSFYYTPQGETEMNLDLILLIDKQFLETPFYGVRHPLGRLLCNRLPAARQCIENAREGGNG